MPSMKVNHDTWLEVSNIVDGTFSPIKGFLGKEDYGSVVHDMCLCSGDVWPIPISLDVSKEVVQELEQDSSLTLISEQGQPIAQLDVTEIFEVDLEETAQKVFGTTDRSHPGVAKEVARYPFQVAGVPKLIKPVTQFFPDLAHSPQETREIFGNKGWSTIAGFQTRNPPHRAHEYLQRVAMELCDGIFLQPLIGWKKEDDFSPDAVVAGYRVMTQQFYPEQHALLGTLATPMRYAGPREAVFHAIIRRNHGCTHFIVGRDHAGVGGFYGKYEAQELVRNTKQLGIEILALSGPYYCSKTGGGCYREDK